MEDAAVSDFEEAHESRLEERLLHTSDTFSEYLMFLIKEKKMENAVKGSAAAGTSLRCPLQHEIRTPAFAGVRKEIQTQASMLVMPSMNRSK